MKKSRGLNVSFSPKAGSYLSPLRYVRTLGRCQQKLAQSALILIALFLLLPTNKAHASGCTPIYGGGPTCTDNSLTIQKQVLNPSSNQFVHNLGLTDPRYHAGDLVTFQISLTNNSTKTLKKIIVKEGFPSVLTYADGPGEFDKSSNILTFEVDNLASHHSELFTVTAHVNPQNTFTQTAYCVSNTVSALPSSGSVVQDSSQLCLEKLKTTPATGAESLELFALLPSALLGLGIKKLTGK